MRRVWAAALGIGLLLAGAGGVMLVRQRLDPEALRRAVIASVERQSGRSMTLERLETGLLPAPYVSAEALTLGDRPDAGAAADPVMLRIGHLRARIGLWPLLRHVVQLDGLAMDHVTLRVRRDADGRVNWQMQPRPADHAGSGSGRGGARWGVAFDSVRIEAIEILCRDDLRHRGADVHLTHLSGSALQGERPHFALTGEQGGAGYTVEGHTGPVRRLLDAADRRTEWPVSVQASETIGNAVVAHGRAAGIVADPAHGNGYDLALNAEIAQLTDLNRLFSHANLPSMRSLDASGRVVDHGHPVLVAFQARAGATVIAGKGRSGGGMAAGLHDLALQGWSVAAAAPTAPIDIAASGSWRGRALAISGTAASLDAVQAMRPGVSVPLRMTLGLGGTRLDVAGTVGAGDSQGGSALPGARLVDADLTLTASDLSIQGPRYRDFTAHAVLQDGRLLVQPFQADGPTGSVAARLQVDAAASPPRLSLSMHPLMLPAAMLARLLGGLDEARGADAVGGMVELVGELQATGAGRSAIAASAQGHVGASMTDGVVANAALLRLIGSSPAVAAMLPAAGVTPVRCAALHAVLRAGQAAVDTLSLRAGSLSVDGHGQVGLADGALELHLVANAQVGTAWLSLPVRLGGNLHDPRPTLDRAGSGGRYALTIGGATDASSECGGPLGLAREGVAGPAAGTPPAGGAREKHKRPRALDILRGLGIVR